MTGAMAVTNVGHCLKIVVKSTEKIHTQLMSTNWSLQQLENYHKPCQRGWQRSVVCAP